MEEHNFIHTLVESKFIKGAILAVKHLNNSALDFDEHNFENMCLS